MFTQNFRSPRPDHLGSVPRFTKAAAYHRKHRTADDFFRMETSSRPAEISAERGKQGSKNAGQFLLAPA
jgi:hypothetical protein